MDNPIISSAAAEGGLVADTLLDAMVKRFPYVIDVAEDLVDIEQSIGSAPLSIMSAKTGIVYYYDATDATTVDDGITCLVDGNGRRYRAQESAAVTLAAIISITNTPPGSPSNNDAYIVGAAPTGAWVGHSDDVAVYTRRGWVFASPKIGSALLNLDTDTNIQFTDAGWDSMATSFAGSNIYPASLLFPGGLSVEAQQNAPPVSITAGLHYLVGTAGSGAWSGHSNDIAYSTDGSTFLFIAAYDGMQVFNKSSDAQLTWFDSTGTWRPVIAIQDKCQGRLTLESGVAISTTDQTAKGTLYFTPYGGNVIALYANGAWAERVFTEVSLSLSGYTTAKPYDIFGYDNAGTLALESLVWTNDTTRATALTTQDGILVKTGDATRRYLGTIYTSATSQCEDSMAKRFVWNEYNAVLRPMQVLEATNTWASAGGTLRQMRSTSTNQLDFVIGRARNVVEAMAFGNFTLTLASPSTGTGTIAIGLDSTTAKAANSLSETLGGQMGNGAAFSGAPKARYADYPGVGRHRLVPLEADTGALSWVGDNGGSLIQSGISGTVFA